LKSLIPVKKTALTPGQFEKLADVPPEIEWLANITNDKTRQAYQNDVTLRDALNHARPSLRAASGQVWTNFFEPPRGLC
jgi:hypothetical protein